MKMRALAALIVTGTVAAPMAGLAADSEDSWSGSLGLGAEYDSNVAVLELDETSGESDYAGLVDFGIAYDRDLGEHGNVTVSYDFSQSLYNEFSEFDLRIHRGSVDTSYDFRVVEAGLMAHYADAGLDGDEFLVWKQLSPYLSKLFGESLYLRGAYGHTEKEYADRAGDRPGRDAEANSISGDAYVFLNGLNTYLVFGLKYEEEDALTDHFDYDGQRYSVQLAQRFHLMQRRLAFKTKLRYEARDYAEPDPLIGAERRDRRYLLKTSLDIPLTDRVTAGINYEYADNRSNLPAVDFEEHVASVRFGFEF